MGPSRRFYGSQWTCRWDCETGISFFLSLFLTQSGAGQCFQTVEVWETTMKCSSLLEKDFQVTPYQVNCFSDNYTEGKFAHTFAIWLYFCSMHYGLYCRRKRCLQGDASPSVSFPWSSWSCWLAGMQVAPQSAGSDSFLMTGWRKFLSDDTIWYRNLQELSTMRLNTWGSQVTKSSNQTLLTQVGRHIIVILS